MSRGNRIDLLPVAASESAITVKLFHYLWDYQHDTDMNEDLDAIPFRLIRHYNFTSFFETVPFNGKTLNQDERNDFVSYLDEQIALYESGLPMMYEQLKEIGNDQGWYNEIERSIVSITLFTTITMADCMVASKYFLMADKEYDRRYMRGKLQIILNEGFKRLYGFKANMKKDDLPEWFRLQPLMNYFPQVIRDQYSELSGLLKSHSEKSLWWKDERNLEVHIDAMKLYESRQEEIIESKVMIESMDLFNALRAVNCFLENANACVVNYLKQQYLEGKLST